MKIIFIIFFSAQISLYAENIILKNGNSYSGTVQKSENSININIKKANVLKINIRKSTKIKINHNLKIPELEYLVLKSGVRMPGYIEKLARGGISITNNTYFINSKVFQKNEFSEIKSIPWIKITLSNKKILIGQLTRESDNEIILLNIISPLTITIPFSELKDYKYVQKIEPPKKNNEESKYDKIIKQINLIKNTININSITSPKTQTAPLLKQKIISGIMYINTLGNYSDFLPQAYALSFQYNVFFHSSFFKSKLPFLFKAWKNIFKPAFISETDLLYFSHNKNEIKAADILFGLKWQIPLDTPNEKRIVFLLEPGLQIASFKSKNDSQTSAVFTWVSGLGYEFNIRPDFDIHFSMRLEYNYDKNFSMYSYGFVLGLLYCL